MSIVLGSCDNCDRTWRSHREAHCTSCCAHFSSDSAFDRHLGRNGCSDPSRLRNTKGELVFVLVPRTSGKCWAIRERRENPLVKRAPGKAVA